MSYAGVTKPETTFVPRRRSRTVLAVAAVVAVGLIVHFTAPGAAGDFLADALYAVMMYLLVALVRPGLAPAGIAVTAYGVCALIELSQLTTGPAALAALFPPARLVLGTTFAPVDLLAYAVGVAGAWGCEVALRRRRRTMLNA